MPNEPNPDLSALWQNQPVQPVKLSLQEISQRSSQFMRRIRMRNLREYAACLLVIASSAYFITVMPSALMRLGHAFSIAGVLYVAYQLHKRGTPPHASEMGRLGAVQFHRRHLERQRDALKSVFSWYLGPLIPGVATIMLSSVIGQHGIAAPSQLLVSGAFIVFACAVFFLIWKINQSGARKIQAKIDELSNY